MRVAIVAESFLPDVNGVTNSVLRVVDHLDQRGHEALIIAPGAGPARLGSTAIERLPSFVLTRYGSLSVAIPTRRVERLLASYRPDVVHLAAPVVLGAAGVAAARRLGLPTVAVYQTDVPAFAAEYGLSLAGRPLWSWLRHVHSRADLTLAPSSASVRQLRGHGIRGVLRWPRGVDQELFHPSQRCDALHSSWSRSGRLVVGYVGRLAPEKSVHLLAPLAQSDAVQIVIVGDGPSRSALERLMPQAEFAGFRSGSELARAFASLDVFVHTGRHETFCQAVQEALSSGVPVVAPAAGGPLDTVQHGGNGFLWDPARPGTMQRAVEALLDPQRRAELAARARPSVAARSWPAVGDELLDHYERLSAGSSARAA